MIDRNSLFLGGARIYLRLLKPEDVNEHYLSWLKDNEVTAFLETRFTPHSLQSINSFVNEKFNSTDTWLFGIFINESEKHIGNIKLGPVNKYHAFAELGILLGEKSFWGQGYAPEAISVACQFGFLNLGLHKIVAGCYSSNVGSIKAFEKVGFEKEGVFKMQYLNNEKYEDAVILGKFKP